MQKQIEYKCKDLVFHFNKKHLEDPSVPMWVIKAHGVTFYVNHVSAEIPWSTKETPDNPSTKGSIKFKKCKLSIDADNCATLTNLGIFDHNLPQPKNSTRIIARDGSSFHFALANNEFKHSKIKTVEGACSTEFIICDLTDKDEVLIAGLKFAGQFRILSPNEPYYQEYDLTNDYIREIYSDEEDNDGYSIDI